MLCDFELLYGFIQECAYLINNLYEHNNYDHLVTKLCNKFVLPIINITKDKHKKEYNTHVKDTKDVDSICLYLLSVCAEKYFKLTQDEYLKIKRFIDNNIDTVEAMLGLCMNFLIYLQNVMIAIVIVHVFAIVNKIIENVYVLLINILNFVKKIALF